MDKRKISPIRLTLFVMLPMLIGALIYYAYRSESLLMFTWASAIGLGPAIDTLRSYMQTTFPLGESWIRDSLPYALWVLALTCFMLELWRDIAGKWKYLWIFWGLVLGAGGELLQYFHLISGTFDPIDFAMVSAAGIVPLLIVRLMNRNHVEFQETEKGGVA